VPPLLSTDLPELDRVEALVDSEAGTVEVVIVSADDPLQTRHVALQLRERKQKR